jgi:hypothetical protein
VIELAGGGDEGDHDQRQSMAMMTANAGQIICPMNQMGDQIQLRSIWAYQSFIDRSFLRVDHVDAPAGDGNHHIEGEPDRSEDPVWRD